MIPFGIHVWFGYYADNCLIALRKGRNDFFVITMYKVKATLSGNGRLRKIFMEKHPMKMRREAKYNALST